MDAVFQWITTYGYGAIFLLLMLGVVGLPIPDETLLVFCGYLISRGRMNPLAAWLSALAGSWCGISLSYMIGRTLGLGFVHRFGKYVHITEARLQKVHEWFDRIGHWALFVGYYIAGVRHFTAIIAGTSCLEYRHFATYAYSGAFVWVCPVLGLGLAIHIIEHQGGRIWAESALGDEVLFTSGLGLNQPACASAMMAPV